MIGEPGAHDRAGAPELPRASERPALPAGLTEEDLGRGWGTRRPRFYQR
jgi:hypothetical protein